MSDRAKVIEAAKRLYGCTQKQVAKDIRDIDILVDHVLGESSINTMQMANEMVAVQATRIRDLEDEVKELKTQLENERKKYRKLWNEGKPTYTNNMSED